MEREVLECALKNCWKDSSVSRVLSVESSPAVGKYENFLSTVSRVSLKVVLANGRVTARSLILKEADFTHQFAIDKNSKYNVFRTETMVYNTVIKEIKFLMEEFEDTDGILWCNLVHHVPYTCLVMEDLKASGFSMTTRGSSWDLDHTLLAVHELGRFHGMCKVLEGRGTVRKEDYKPWFIFNSAKVHKHWFWSMRAALRGIKKYWSPVWRPIVNKISLTEGSLYEKMRGIESRDENIFKVLNHGDCHKNNVMFRYNCLNHPIEIRFLDFQLPHYGSPCCDLTYMLYLGPDPFVRRNNYDLILKTYHDSLLRTLVRYSFNGIKPEMDEIEDLMDKYSFFGMYMFITGYAREITSAELGEEFFDTEKIMALDGEAEDSRILEIFNSEVLEEAVGPDLERFVKEFF